MNSEYLTKDLGEAAALLCKNIRFLKLQRESRFFWFVFKDRERCLNLSKDFWFGELLVNAKSYREALETLKNRLFATKEK